MLKRKRIERKMFDGTVHEAFVVKLDETELTLRFILHMVQRSRPEGMTPSEVLDDIEAHGDHVMRGMLSDLRQCAKIAMYYFAEQVAGGANPVGGKMTMEKIEPSEGSMQ